MWGFSSLPQSALPLVLTCAQPNAARVMVPAFPGRSEGCAGHPARILRSRARSAGEARRRDPEPPRREGQRCPAGPHLQVLESSQWRQMSCPSPAPPKLQVHEQKNNYHCFKPLHFGSICSATWNYFFRTKCRALAPYLSQKKCSLKRSSNSSSISCCSWGGK